VTVIPSIPSSATASLTCSELEQFDDGFQLFHLKVNSTSRDLLQSEAKRSTRSLSNAVIASTVFLQWRCHHERSVAKSKYPAGLSLVSLLDFSAVAQNCGLDLPKIFFGAYTETDDQRPFCPPASATLN
jgi:hypothetical protein